MDIVTAALADGVATREHALAVVTAKSQRVDTEEILVKASDGEDVVRQLVHAALAVGLSGARDTIAAAKTSIKLEAAMLRSIDPVTIKPVTQEDVKAAKVRRG